MPKSLRPYQVDIINKVRQKFKEGKRRVLIRLATGGGKTLLASTIIKSAIAKGNKVLFLCHRRELVKQSVEALRGEGVNVGIVAGGFNFKRGHDCYVCSVPTLVKRLRVMRGFSLVVFDECHHSRSATFEKCWQAYYDSAMLGLSASPARLDRKPLGECFDSMVHGPEIQDLIDMGFLSDFKYYAPSRVDLSAVKTLAGDYHKGQLAEVMDKPHITGDAVQHYLKVGVGKRCIVFCVSINHSKAVADEYNKHGIPAAHVDANSKMDYRDKAMEEFKNGRIKVLTNCNLFSEGVDVPKLDMVQILRPTKSLVLHLQIVGRCLRPDPGKERAYILDHVCNYEHHGLPTEVHEWSLGKKVDEDKNDKASQATKTCPKCMMVLASTTRVCPCGHVFKPTKQREIDEVEGELVELDRKAYLKKRKQEVRAAKTFDELHALGISRGYNYPKQWAGHILKERERWKRK